MPYFKVILSGKDIRYPFDGAPEGVVGFFTTRVVKASDISQAHSAAEELVLSEWRPGGQYAQGNRGSIPVLAVEESFPIGLMTGIFGRKPAGYSFYQHDD